MVLAVRPNSTRGQMNICAAPGCERVARTKKRGLCNAHETRLKRHGSLRLDRPIVLVGAGLAARFWQKVEVAGPNECWPWTGGRRTCDGAKVYGLISVGHRPNIKRESVHR